MKRELDFLLSLGILRNGKFLQILFLEYTAQQENDEHQSLESQGEGPSGQVWQVNEK